MAKHELVLEDALQVFQDTHAAGLGDATADSLSAAAADRLEVAGSQVRTGITLDQAQSGQSKGCSVLMTLQQGRRCPFPAQGGGGTGCHALTGFYVLHERDPGHAIVQAKPGGVYLEPPSFRPVVFSNDRRCWALLSSNPLAPDRSVPLPEGLVDSPIALGRLCCCDRLDPSTRAPGPAPDGTVPCPPVDNPVTANTVSLAMDR
ncbi:MAG: hypothetical protein H6975_07065 [Gammaproteobacteria bacterium]|nr:hypothetical protein [Gammaproteobacteria bacterium]